MPFGVKKKDASSTRNRIIDVTLYNGEPVLALRLAYLADDVDQFIIVEARHTHAGAEKLPNGGLYSERPDVVAILALYGDKVRVVVLDRFPEMPEDWPAQRQADKFIQPDAYPAWFREMYQRDFITAELLAAVPVPVPTFYTVCDLDEIPSTNFLRFVRTATTEQLRNPLHIQMKMYYYSFAWVKSARWAKAFVISHECLADFAEAGVTLSDVRNPNSANALKRWQPAMTGETCGWHLSYFLSRAGIRRKLEAFAHRECDSEAVKASAHIDACFAEGRDLFDRKGDEQLYPTPPTEAADQMGPSGSAFQDFMTLIQAQDGETDLEQFQKLLRMALHPTL